MTAPPMIKTAIMQQHPVRQRRFAAPAQRQPPRARHRIRRKHVAHLRNRLTAVSTHAATSLPHIQISKKISHRLRSWLRIILQLRLISEIDYSGTLGTTPFPMPFSALPAPVRTVLLITASHIEPVAALRAQTLQLDLERAPSATNQIIMIPAQAIRPSITPATIHNARQRNAGCS